MISERALVSGVTSIVLLAALASGPLVSGIDLSSPPDSSENGILNPNSGNASINVVGTPSTARLEKKAFSEDAPYTLYVPDTTVVLSDVTGTSLLIYKIRIPELGYTRGTTHFLNSSSAGRQSIELKPGELRDKNLAKDSYRGEIVLLIRPDGPERTVYNGNVTVRVDQ